MSTSELTSAQRELEQAQAALVQAKEKAREEQAQLEHQAQYVKTVSQAQARTQDIIALARKLEEADTDNVFTITYPTNTIKHYHKDYEVETANVTFELNGRDHTLEIEEHITYGHGGFHRCSNGIKFHLYGDYTDYRNKWVKKPATIIKAVEALQTIAVTERTEAKRKASLAERATLHLEVMYPDADVEFVQGHNFGSGRNRQHAPDRVTVKTDKGSYTFTYFEKEGKIELRVWKRVMGREVEDQVRKLILG